MFKKINRPGPRLDFGNIILLGNGNSIFNRRKLEENNEVNEKKNP